MSIIAMPSDLAQIIEVHRNLFGGFTMMADEASPDGQEAPIEGDKPKGQVSFTSEQQEHINSLLADQKRRAKPADYDDLRAKASKFDELEQAKKSELEKLAEDRDAQRKRGDAAELSYARLEVALEKGLTATQAKRLVGSTREELEADADELVKDLGVANGPKSPKPNPAQGRGEESTGSGDWLRDSLARN